MATDCEMQAVHACVPAAPSSDVRFQLVHNLFAWRKRREKETSAPIADETDVLPPPPQDVVSDVNEVKQANPADKIMAAPREAPTTPNARAIAAADNDRAQNNNICFRMLRQCMEPTTDVNSRERDPVGGLLEPQYTAAFQDATARGRFIRGVYAILALQLLYTAAFVTFFTVNAEWKLWVIQHQEYLCVAMFGYLLTLYSLICYDIYRMTFPINYILLFLLTNFLSYLTTFVTYRYLNEVVVAAVAATAVVCLIMTGLAICIKDATPWLCMVSALFMGLMLTNLILFACGAYTRYSPMHLIFACLAAFLMSMYLLIDTQMIMGGRQLEIPDDDYIMGALLLYIDIILLFWYILDILGILGADGN